MYENFYHLDADPFRLSPDHRFGFAHSSFGKAKAYMKYALHRAEGFVMITGAPGSGKTTLINELLDELSQAEVKVAMLSISQLDADDLLRMVAFSFGLAGASDDKATIIHALSSFLTTNHKAGRRALLIVDEAQDLAVSAMEELRLLTNLQIDSHPLLQIFLLGQNELRDLMQDPAMVQCHQRIVAASHLETLNAEETGDYIMHRLRTAGWCGKPLISTTVFPIIHRYSQGIPRTINQICSRLFLHAYVEQLQKVGVRDIATVLFALQEEQLVPSDSLLHPTLTDDAFKDREDHFPRDTEIAPQPETATEDVAAIVPARQALQSPVLQEIETGTHPQPEPEPEPDPEPEPEPEREPGAAKPLHQVEAPRALEAEESPPDNVATFPAPEPPPGDDIPAKSGGTLRVAGLAAAISIFAMGGAFYLYETASLSPVRVAQWPGQSPVPNQAAAAEKPPSPQVARIDYSPSGETLELELERLPPTSAGDSELEPLQIPDQTPASAAVDAVDPVGQDRSLDVTSVTEEVVEREGEVLQVLFAYRSMEIPPEFEVLLDRVVDDLKDSPSSTASIIGIVENRGKAPSEVNINVSNARAQIVRNYLLERGIDADRLTVKADTHLLENRQGAERQPERVVEVTVLYSEGLALESARP